MKLFNSIIKMNNRQRVITIFVLGIMIRLILMPFFGHGDILSTYKRAYDSAFSNVNVFSYEAQLSHIIEIINLKIYDIFFDRNNLLPLTLSVQENQFTNVNLFIFKLPYLFFDIASFLLIYKLVKKSKYLLISLSFYFLNPILLFSVYIFGRYETFPIGFMLLALYYLKRERLLLSSIVFGFAILTRFSFVLLLPFYFVFISKNIYKKFSVFHLGDISIFNFINLQNICS